MEMLRVSQLRFRPSSARRASLPQAKPRSIELIRHACRSIFALLVTVMLGALSAGAAPPAPPPSVRLYVLDGGTLHITDTTPFGLRRSDVATSDLAVPVFLVVHPRGTLLWDAGAVPDADWQPTGAPVRHRLVLPDGGKRDLTMRRPLLQQLAEIGYAPADVTWLALSHYHYDHTANANAFASATWLVRAAERDAMFAAEAPGLTRPSTYAALRESRTMLIEGDEHDVFGDGAVVIKAAPGHTPGHQVLLVKLARRGNVVLSGDLYHYPEERALDSVPTFEFDQAQTHASRTDVADWLRENDALLWIQHDYNANAKLKKAPEYYE
jgi:glyoxylase-like metal-dependent hydrolase (beta-lactamase superfamily II)